MHCFFVGNVVVVVVLLLKEEFSVSAQKKRGFVSSTSSSSQLYPLGRKNGREKNIDCFCSLCAVEREQERVNASRKVRSKRNVPSKTLAREDNTSLRSLSRRIQMPFLLSVICVF